MADKPDEQSTALAVRNQHLEAALRAVVESDETAIPASSDPEIVSRMILERIANAATFEEAFKAQKIPAWRAEYLDRPVKITDVRFNRSEFFGKEKDGEGKGAPIYAVVDLVDVQSGETATVTCGGRNVLVQLVKLLQNPDWMRNAVRLTGKRTSEGYQALWLEAA